MDEISRKLSTIKRIKFYALSRVVDYAECVTYDIESLSKYIKGPIIETDDRFLIPCSHVFPSSATEYYISTLLQYLKGETLPDLLELLQSSNGPNLFRIKYLGRGYRKDFWRKRYNILSVQQLIKTNEEFFQLFISNSENDDEVADYKESLNYLAFCDLANGDYLAVVTKGSERNTVFYLDHDYAYYPFGTSMTQKPYGKIANSISEWLDILINTNGEKGTGVNPFYL